jgi:methyl-accepting chemotaxis protein
LKGLEKILSGVSETTQLVAQITRATEEQLNAGQEVRRAIETAAAQSNMLLLHC